jgi:D-psicose/D-tagatose/L-ribulose 3-epimerase
MNPIGANTWIWTSPLDDAELASIAPRVAEWGFDLIELPVENVGDWDPEGAAELLSDLGLGASVAAVMAPSRDLLADDDETVDRTRRYLIACLDAAALVGAPAVAGPMYAPTGRVWRIPPGDRPRLVARLARALRPVVAHAESVGVRLAIEPLNRYETSFVNTVEQGLEVVEAVGSDSCGLLLDTYHMNIEEKDPAAAIRAAGSHIAHFHACGNDRGAPGADHTDWPALAAALREVGYSGNVVIESFTAKNESIATAASIWRPLAESQDAIAVDGLAFLRSLLGDAGTAPQAAASGASGSSELRGR